MSAGILAAIAPESIERLLLGADSALYSAKRAGRDRTVVSTGPGAGVHADTGAVTAGR